MANVKTPHQMQREIDEFLADTDRKVAASRARGGSYVGESGEYDHALYEAANRAAGIRLDRKRDAKMLASRRRSYAVRSKKPTRANLGARIADLETLRSWTVGEERERYARELEAARREYAAR